ncbi:hypothetical protein RB595_001587 [Gaeumannomyces hyphopodioides]
MHDETMADGDAQNPPHRLVRDCIHVELRGSMDVDPAPELPEELTIIARPKPPPSDFDDSSELSSPPSSPETPWSADKKVIMSPAKSTRKAKQKEASPAAKKKASPRQEPVSPTPAAAGRRKTPRAATPVTKAAPAAAAAADDAGSPPPAKKPRAAAAPAKAVKVAVKSAASKIAKPVLTVAQRRKKARWAAPSVYTSTRSPLADGKVDLRDMLCHASAWDGLSEAQRARLLAVMPARFVKDGARPDALALSNSDDFRHDCARYVGNIGGGRHDPEWIRQARDAHDRRAAGEFDDYLRAKFRDDFEVDPPQGFPEDGRKPRGGEDVGTK